MGMSLRRLAVAVLALAVVPVSGWGLDIQGQVMVEQSVDGGASWFLVTPAPKSPVRVGDQVRITATLINDSGFLGQMCADDPSPPGQPDSPCWLAACSSCRFNGGQGDCQDETNGPLGLKTGQYWIWPNIGVGCDSCPMDLSPFRSDSPVGLISADDVMTFYHNGKFLQTVEAYDPVGEIWTTKADMPTARGKLAVGVVGGMIYAIGGWGGDGTVNDTYLGTVEEYNPVANSWVGKTAMPTPREHLAVAVVAGKIYAIGGRDASGVLGTVEEYTPGVGWLPKSPMPTPRFWLGVAVVAGKIYAIGGYDSAGAITGVVEEYDPAFDIWSGPRTPMPIPRGALTATTVSGKIYTLGGDDNGFSPFSGQPSHATPIIEEYDPAGDAWTPKTSWFTGHTWVSSKARHGAAALAGKIYAFGGAAGHFDSCGFGGYTCFTSQTNIIGEMYDPAAGPTGTMNSFAPFPVPIGGAPGPMPTGRSMLAVAVANDGAIDWLYAIGGFDDNRYYHDHIVGYANTAAVSWTFSATAEWDELDFIAYAFDDDDGDGYSPPFDFFYIEGAYCGLNAIAPPDGEEGTWIDCNAGGCPLKGDGTLGTVLNTYWSGGSLSIKSPLDTHSLPELLLSPGETRPSSGMSVLVPLGLASDPDHLIAYIGDVIQITTSITNTGAPVTIAPGEACSTPRSPKNDIVEVFILPNKIVSTTVCLFSFLDMGAPCGTGPYGVQAGSPSVSLPTFANGVHTWTFSVTGKNGCGALGGCGAGSEGAGTVFTKISVRGAISQTATIYVRPAPLIITGTLWVDPDGAGPIAAFKGGPMYYMSDDQLEARFTFSNDSPSYVFDISPVSRTIFPLADIMLVSAPAPGPYQLATKGSPGDSVTLTWVYAPAPGGAFATTCPGPLFALDVTAGARGVCHTESVELRDTPFSPNAGCLAPCIPARTMVTTIPGLVAVGDTFQVIVDITSNATREVVIGAGTPGSVTMYLEKDIATPAVDWTVQLPYPTLSSSSIWASGETKSFTWFVRADGEGFFNSKIGLNWGGVNVGLPCRQACKMVAADCVVVNKTEITPPNPLTIISLTASPSLPGQQFSTCDEPTGFVALRLDLENTDTDGKYIVIMDGDPFTSGDTAFCESVVIGTQPPAGGFGFPKQSTDNPPAPTDSPNPPLPIVIPPLSKVSVTWWMDTNCYSTASANPPASYNLGCTVVAVKLVQGWRFTDTDGNGVFNAPPDVILGPVSGPVSPLPPVSITTSRPAKLTCSIWTDNSDYSVGLPITIFFSVSNNGGNGVENFTVSMTPATTGGGGVDPVVGPVPAPALTFTGTGTCNDLAFGTDTEVYMFQYVATKPGKVVFSGLASGNDWECGVLKNAGCSAPEITIASAALLTCQAEATPLVTMSISCTGCAPQSTCNPDTGQDCIVVTMDASNFGDIAVENAQPSLGFPEAAFAKACDRNNVCPNVTPTLGSIAWVIGPAEAVTPDKDIAAFTTASYTWTYSPTGLGCVQVLTTIKGKDKASGVTLYCDTRTKCVEILGRYPLELSLVSVPENVALGGTFIVTVQVCNPGDTPASMQGGEPTLQFHQVSTGANITDKFEVVPPAPAAIMVGECATVPIVVTTQSGASFGKVEVKLSEGDLFIARDLATGSPVPALDKGGSKIINVVDNTYLLSILTNPCRLSEGELCEFRYRIADVGKRTTLKIYTLTGELVGTLVDKVAVVEDTVVRWNGRTGFTPVSRENGQGRFVASGVYLVRIEGPNYTAIKKLAIVK